MANGIDYQEVLADLIAKRDKLDGAIAGIQAMLGLQGGSGMPEEPGALKQSPQAQLEARVESDSFFGMTVIDATVKYLRMVKKKQSIVEIARALEAGGLTHAASDFTATVRSMVHRESTKGDVIVKVGRGEWGLKEWYPGARASKMFGTTRAQRRGSEPEEGDSEPEDYAEPDSE